MTTGKKRLDLLVLERGLAESQNKAQAFIMAGLVTVDGVKLEKAGQMVDVDSLVTVKEKDHPYVSRGGVKLASALEHFGKNPTGLTCLDVGASTGGFTDCLLQSGAKKVWAIDTGSNQLDYMLREDERVISMEGVNARDIDLLLIKDPIDLLVADVSFISLKLVIPPLLPALKKDATLILLVKPQFEAEREKVGKGGIVKDPKIHEEVINDLVAFFHSKGLTCLGVIASPIEGRKGNIEYFINLAFEGGDDAGRVDYFTVDNIGR